MSVDVVFHTQSETAMTIEQHIEELRAELRDATNRSECRQIEAELVLALAEREAMLAEAEGRYSSEPPF